MEAPGVLPLQLPELDDVLPDFFRPALRRLSGASASKSARIGVEDGDQERRRRRRRRPLVETAQPRRLLVETTRRRRQVDGRHESAPEENLPCEVDGVLSPHGGKRLGLAPPLPVDRWALAARSSGRRRGSPGAPLGGGGGQRSWRDGGPRVCEGEGESRCGRRRGSGIDRARSNRLPAEPGARRTGRSVHLRSSRNRCCLARGWGACTQASQAMPLPPVLFPAAPLCVAARRATGAMASASRSSSSFDAAAFEAERLRLDAAARAGMEATAAAAGAGADPRAWKWAIRKRVWDALEAEGVARDPRPVHHRIPNFDGAPAAADALGRLDVFQNSQCVKVNPDSPQKQVRFLTLSGDKKLLTPQPRLRTGFFSVLDSQMIPIGGIPEACTSVGAAKYGRPIGLDERIKVDLIVIGSVAVDPNSGARLGKGEGFAELEYGMLRYMGAIDDSTMIVTTVHDKQLVDDIPVERLLVHDVPVDIICTPTQVIFTKTTIPKPQGIYWEKLSPEKLGQIRILRELKKRIEQETGNILPCGPSEQLPPTAQRRRGRRRR